MRYFTKYLPEKGEIKVGDYVRSESFGNRRVQVTEIMENGDFATDEPDVYEPGCYYILPKSKAKKVTKELYLCSYNIEIGDNISPTGEAFFTAQSHHVEKHKGEYFKVIGPISSEAIWIKENNELLHQDLVFAIYPPEHENAYEVGTVNVRCPTCKTFH